MEIKIFGKKLFSVNKGEQYISLASDPQNEINKSKYLPDFYKRRGDNFSQSWTSMGDISVATLEDVSSNKKGKKKTAKKVVKKKIEITPKGVFELKLLHDKSFQLNTNEEYIDEQIKTFTEKLELINAEEWDVENGVREISSMLIRFENRKKYNKDLDELFSQFPYTSTSLIGKVMKNHSHLKMDKVAQFLADMPKEAVDAMKDYNKYTKKICDKQAVFYIIADKKDFEKTDNRRDPILLAQSPFGHFWQILGAWDKEMLFLEEL